MHDLIGYLIVFFFPIMSVLFTILAMLSKKPKVRVQLTITRVVVPETDDLDDEWDFDAIFAELHR